jgi:ABC-type glycerol-3-phosphate transport system substrate-binding protein
MLLALLVCLVAVASASADAETLIINSDRSSPPQTAVLALIAREFEQQTHDVSVTINTLDLES